MKMMNKEQVLKELEQMIKITYGKTLKSASNSEKYYALSKVLLGMIAAPWEATQDLYSQGRQAYYFSAEFLMGRALGNNLINLGLYEDMKEVLEAADIDLNALEEAESDAGLGNGGLGRLAACFMDSGATLNEPLMGYGIRYDYGIFKQSFVDGFQVEVADEWLKNGDPMSVRKAEEAVRIDFSGEKVNAVPYDTPITGYDTQNVNTLRLWKAEALEAFDFVKFNDQAYDASVVLKNRAEDISRVLYPNDSTNEGKILRLKQQYFFVSASLQDMIRKYKAKHGSDFSKFADLHAVQLNDTHPVLAIPEFLRLLMDVEGYSFEAAFEISSKVFSYTNHTILSEALEKWWMGLFESLLPRILEIVTMIDQRLEKDFKGKGLSDEKIASMRIIQGDMIHMAWLAIYGTHTTNGVAEIHTEILKHQELNDWYALYPERFQNKTNGITPRRWIALANPELTSFITELLGTEAWLKDLTMLEQLKPLAEDEAVIEKFMAIKKEKKRQLKMYIEDQEGIRLDENALFDIQIKRLHEYKRQLLNAFHILDLYFRLKEDPKMLEDFAPQTFIFGAKSAPGYFRAKGIIKYINEIAKTVNTDPALKGKLKVVFVQNYRVSYAERLFPAADVSEQISTAGKEASGTGNMKFMLNGTPTIGTLDGANVEIVEAAGLDNNFIFGLTVEEILDLKENYDPKATCDQTPGLRRVVETLVDGTFDDGGTGMFKELYTSLFEGAHWHAPDNYFIMADFAAYRQAQEKLNHQYKDTLAFGKMCWINMCTAGKFNSDRTILDYSNDIWYIKANKL